MEKQVKRVKRPHVKWNDVRLEIGDQAVDADFYRLLTKHPTMSRDRVAYNALKKHYSTTTLARIRWLGVSLEGIKSYEL